MKLTRELQGGLGINHTPFIITVDEYVDVNYETEEDCEVYSGSVLKINGIELYVIERLFGGDYKENHLVCALLYSELVTQKAEQGTEVIMESRAHFQYTKTHKVKKAGGVEIKYKMIEKDYYPCFITEEIRAMGMITPVSLMIVSDLGHTGQYHGVLLKNKVFS